MIFREKMSVSFLDPADTFGELGVYQIGQIHIFISNWKALQSTYGPSRRR